MADNRALDNLAGELMRVSYTLGEYCTDLIRDAELSPHENIGRIGHALALLFQIEDEIWKVRPDLETRVVKKEWNQPPQPRAKCTIRTATPADQEAILALLPQLFEAPGSRPPTYTDERGRTGIRWALERPDAEILLALDGDALVGLASVYTDIQSIRYGKRCWLQDLVVSKEARGRGIGKRLLDAASEWARERGCTHLQLSSGMGRVDAHRFYRREEMTEEYVFERWIGAG